MRQASIGARAPFTIRILSTVAALGLLAGCQTATAPGGDATRGTALGTSVQLIERDVEAPEAFQTTELALWDGRPSLGGIWIASPDVREPERVIIRNEETGKFVIGALFRRERLAPGPRLQLSSDAAAAVGAIAGTPVTLDVVALRREAAPEPETEAPQVEAVAAAPTVEPVVEVETAAPEAAPELPGTVEVDVLRIAARALAERRAAEAAAAEAAARVEALESATPPEVSATSLDAPVEEASLATDAATAEVARATPRRRGFAAMFGRDRSVGLPEPLPTAAIEAALPDAAFVQIGLYANQLNAEAVAKRLAGAGVMPSVVPQGEAWRVVVGPAPTEADRAAVLRKAKAMGFPDAYVIAG